MSETKSDALHPSSVRQKVAGISLVVFAAVSWGSWSLFLKPSGLDGLSITPLLLTLVFVASLPFAWAEEKPVWSRRLALLLLAFSVLDAINYATFFSAMSKTSVAIAVLTHCVAPLFVAVASPYVDGEEIPHAKLAVLVALLGLTLLLEPWKIQAAGSVGSSFLGAGLGLISAIAYAGNIFLMRRLGASIGPARTMGYHALLASLFLWPVAGFSILWASNESLWLVLLASLGPGALAGMAFVRGLSYLPTATASTLAFLEPLTACALSIFLWNEGLPRFGWLGAIFVLGPAAYMAMAKPRSTTPSELIAKADA